ncbi:MAG: hypothetical protein JJE21_06310 [Spirochaetaceae bacterium]|nr:hypothetical protein [Spirochaetaceae bacterium]
MIEINVKLRNKDFDENEELEIRESLNEIKSSLASINKQADNMKYIQLIIMSNRETLSHKDKVSAKKNAIIIVELKGSARS